MENISDVNSSEVEEDLTGTFLGYPEEYKAQIIIYWIELFLIVILNLIVIILVIRRSKNSWMFFNIMHLAISDLTVGLFYVLHFCLWKAFGWHGSEGFCKLIKYLAYVSLYASSAMLVVLSTDRLYALACPISAAKRRKRYKYITVLVGWLISFFVALPIPILGARLKVYRNETICDLVYDVELRKPLTTIFTMFVLFIPAIIIIVCYVAIVILLWRKSCRGPVISKATAETRRHKQQLKNMNIEQTKVIENALFMSNTFDGETEYLRTSQNESNILTRARKRSIEMTFLVVLAFILSWSPICFNYLLSSYGLVSYGGYYYILRGLAPLNSVINPIVFLIFTRCMKTADRERNETIRNHTRSSLMCPLAVKGEHGNTHSEELS